MSILIQNESDIELSEDMIKIVQQVIHETLDYEKCPYETEVSVTMVSNEEIQVLNKEYRDKDQVTDVLSFPLIEYEAPGDFAPMEANEDETLFNLDSGELVLGDIVVSLEKAKEQAEDYGHSFERELGFLVVHSMLHLLGYDHMTEEEEQVMLAHQKEILDKVGLKR